MIAIGFLTLAAAAAVVRAVVGRRLNGDWPLGTLTVNVLGALALGTMAGASDGALTMVGVGGLGTLTTFSSFAHETHNLVVARRRLAAATYVALSLGLGVAAAWGGILIAE